MLLMKTKVCQIFILIFWRFL